MSRETVFGIAKSRKVDCPSCVKKQRVDTLYESIDHWKDNEIMGVKEYYVFQCRGCETKFFAKATSNSEDYSTYFNQETGLEETEYPYNISIWPTLPKVVSNRLPHFPLYIKSQRTAQLLLDVYKAADNELNTLAAIGARTTFDNASEFLDIDPNLSFAEKLEELRKKGHISGREKGQLEVLVDAGSAAAHRGWAPSSDELGIIVEILNSFLETNLLRGDAVKMLKDKVPKKKS